MNTQDITQAADIKYPATCKIEQAAYIAGATAERERSLRFAEWCGKEQWLFVPDYKIWVAAGKTDCTTPTLFDIFLKQDK